MERLESQWSTCRGVFGTERARAAVVRSRLSRRRRTPPHARARTTDVVSVRTAISPFRSCLERLEKTLLRVRTHTHTHKYKDIFVCVGVYDIFRVLSCSTKIAVERVVYFSFFLSTSISLSSVRVLSRLRLVRLVHSSARVSTLFVVRSSYRRIWNCKLELAAMRRR